MGAGLDVHEGEPPPAKYGFAGRDNVICTTHFAWYSEYGVWDILVAIIEDFKRFLDSMPPAHLLNPEELESGYLRLGQ